MVEIKQVPRNNSNRHLFRQIARETSGEVFDVPEGDEVFFAYDRHPQRGRELVGVGCFTAATDGGGSEDGDARSDSSSSSFCCPTHHLVTYLFVKPRHKGRGIGSHLMYRMQSKMMSGLRRSIRVKSAERAVRFFQKHGFKVIGQPLDCVHSGSPLFARLYDMEKTVV